MIKKYPQQQFPFSFLEKPNTQISLQNEDANEPIIFALSKNKEFFAFTFKAAEGMIWIKLWDLTFQRISRKIISETVWLTGKEILEFSPDNKYLIYAQYNKIVLLDIGTLRRKIIHVKNIINYICISSNFQLCCTASGKYCSIWDIKDGISILTLQHNLNICNCILLKSGQYLITVALDVIDTKYYFWNLETRKLIKIWMGKGKGFISEAFELNLKEEQTLLIVIFECQFPQNYLSSIQIWNLFTFSVIRTLSMEIERSVDIFTNSTFETKLIEHLTSKKNNNKVKKRMFVIFDFITFESQKITSFVDSNQACCLLPDAIITFNDNMKQINVNF